MPLPERFTMEQVQRGSTDALIRNYHHSVGRVANIEEKERALRIQKADEQGFQTNILIALNQRGVDIERLKMGAG